MEKIADQLNFPTSIAIDQNGTVYVAESGLPFGGAPAGGVVSKVNNDGTRDVLLKDLRPPVNGLTWFEGSLLISEGGNPKDAGRISRLYLPSRKLNVLVDGLPSFGNYHTNMVVVSPDEKALFFSQGAVTNSGIVGLDSRDLPWLRELQHSCDIPGYDITVSYYEAESADPRASDGSKVKTGGFAPFGTSNAGQRIAWHPKCTAAVLRCNIDGSGLEVFAWGLRNAYGLGFIDGKLFALDQGADERGSRPIKNCPDFLYEVKKGKWYGWPDFFGGKRRTDPSQFVLANHEEMGPPERPQVEFPPHVCATKFTVIPDGNPQAGDLIVACFGDEKPMTAPAGEKVGRDFMYVSTREWWIQKLGNQGLQRPIDVAFCPSSKRAYVLDFGPFEMGPQGAMTATAGSGGLWRAPRGFPGPICRSVSFYNDLVPIFRQFRGSMLWRLDLTNYEHVKANAEMIYGRLTSDDDPMPMPPFPPLTKQQVAKFKEWMDCHFPP